MSDEELREAWALAEERFKNEHIHVHGDQAYAYEPYLEWFLTTWELIEGDE